MKADKDLDEAINSQQLEESENLKNIPPWSSHITIRGLATSLVVGFLYSFIVMKLSLTSGLAPSLNASAALVSFLMLKSWTKMLHMIGVVTTPFTQQENTVVQTCVVACYTISLGGGFGSYLLALNKKTYEQAGMNTEGNVPGSYKEPGIGWMTGFLFAISFVGLFVLVPFRKILIIDYKLPYPSGTAAGVLINGFHSKQVDQMAKKQVHAFTKYFTISFLWSLFQWFYTGGDACGFLQFPTFGLKAWKATFFFDFSLTYIGAGMICSHLVNLSLMLGSVISWGIMWPLISKLKGDWYSGSIPEGSMSSLQGYKVFLAIALILGDGLYTFLKVSTITTISIHARARAAQLCEDEDNHVHDDLQRDEVFNRDNIPTWLACSSYAVLTVAAIIAIPFMFHQVKWYYIVVAYILVPVLSFCNGYGVGLTDHSMAYNYGKAALFIFAAWAGKDNGVVAGLVVCGVTKAVAYNASNLMQDFKTGHLTLTSPRSMLISQIIGTSMGCCIAPLVFFLFYNAFDVGNPNGHWKAPYALIYRNMAIVGVEGLSALPQHCLQLCYGFFSFAILANLIRDLLPVKYGSLIPLPMVMAIPFLVGASFAIDMCIGSLVVFVWHKINSKKATLTVPAVASGLMCGDGIWSLFSSILALAKVKAPICMQFVPGN